MKKRVMIMLCSAMLIAGMTVPVAAAVSPVGQKDTTVTTDKAAKAPKTGEGNFAVYTMAGVLLLGGAAAAAGKRMKED